MRSISRLTCVLGGLLFLRCSANDSASGVDAGGLDPRGGAGAHSGGATATGGQNAGVGGTSKAPTGGQLGVGGSVVPPSGGAALGNGGGTSTNGGRLASGGVGPASGGSTPQPGTGGATAGSGGKGFGGFPPLTGGAGGAAGGRASGGAANGGAANGGAANGGKGGGTAGAPSTAALDCSAIPAMPTGGTDHCGTNTQGKAGGQAWSLWCNMLSSSACITTFDAPAFTARWSNNNDFLARVGLEFGNNGKPYEEYGTLKAEFAFTKSGSAGNFSYIGIYGWTTNPCVEWYIVDDRYGSFPFDAFNATLKGTTAAIDGEVYKLFQNQTNGSGGSRCSGVSQWDQYWSIRQKGRQCGTITISEHFKAWEAAGLPMGGLLEAKILVETGGGTGQIDFPYARVTAE